MASARSPAAIVVSPQSADASEFENTTFGISFIGFVLADADVERAANAAVYYSMQNGGQTCISIERAYVEAPIYDDFVARVAKKVGKLRNRGIEAAAWRRHHDRRGS